jgi:hypothetical protein
MWPLPAKNKLKKTLENTEGAIEIDNLEKLAK